MSARQLALPFAHVPEFDAAEYIPADSNDAARAWLARPGEWPCGRLAVWGEAGTGKTHLLHVWADVVVNAAYLRGVPRLPGAARIAIDDADLCNERALLHLLNAADEENRLVLLAARLPPARWNVALPDLASRLRATAAVEIEPPDEALLRALFARVLAERQMSVPAFVQDWLLARLPRTAAAIREAAARLDHAALAAGGRVTRPVAARMLEELAEEGESEPFREDYVSEREEAAPDAVFLL